MSKVTHSCDLHLSMSDFRFREVEIGVMRVPRLPLGTRKNKKEVRKEKEVLYYSSRKKLQITVERVLFMYIIHVLLQGTFVCILIKRSDGGTELGN